MKELSKSIALYWKALLVTFDKDIQTHIVKAYFRQRKKYHTKVS